MNAIEMAVKAMLEKSMNNVMERIPDILANLPPDMQAAIAQTLRTAVSFQAQLDRIESQNRLIIDHLKIGTGENSEGTQNGQARISGPEQQRPDLSNANDAG